MSVFGLHFQIKWTFLSLNKLITRLLENMDVSVTDTVACRNVRVIRLKDVPPRAQGSMSLKSLGLKLISYAFATYSILETKWIVFWNNYINTTFHIMFKNVYYMFVTVSLAWSSGLFVLRVEHMIAGSSEVSRIISFLGIHQIPEVEAICHMTGTSLAGKDAARQDQANSFIFIHLQMKVGVPVERIVSATLTCSSC